MADSNLTLATGKSWKSSDWKQYFLKRLSLMEAKRAEVIESIWAQADEQIKAESFYDNDGVLNVNIPLEKTLGEIYMGRTEGKVNFDIVPD